MPDPRRATPSKCAACNRPMNTPFICDSCHSLHPAEGLSHFELFNLPPAYDVDPAALRQKYLELSRNTHPDQQSAADPSLAMRVSAQLNEAHRVLRDPVLRAEYLLELAGGESATGDKTVPPEVLATTLEMREQIADAKLEDDQAALDSCRARVKQHCDETLAQVAALAHRLPGDDALRKDLRAALNAMKYFTKLRSEL
jgi:molecular chaperone HscB